MSSNSLFLEPALIQEAAARALGEDVGPADLTSLATVPAEKQARACVLTREPCLVAGLPLARQVFEEADISLTVKELVTDGQKLDLGQKLLWVEGRAQSILKAERVALNFLQQLSAVATQTRAFVDAIKGTQAQILDTRKTIPGLRALQKYAVRCGGGENHRKGLYDAFLIKDNHLVLMGDPHGWKQAIEKARALDPHACLEVEADTLEQVRLFASLDVDRVLLDNMTLEQLRTAVDLIQGRAQTEASGNMTLDRVRDVAQCGVDFISVGALTHSIRSIDLSLEIECL